MSSTPGNPSTKATARKAPREALLLDRLAVMLRIRLFERAIERLFQEGRIGGTTHLSIGQEAVAAGACAALRPDDLVVSTHRGHGHLLAKGAAAGPALAEIAGRRDGYCLGKGGSQHVAVPSIGHMGSNGITGGGIPIAAGIALACLMRRDPRVAMGFLGDGAVGTGNFHETLNLAALWRLPLVLVCENNRYAMSTPVEEAIASPSLAALAGRYGGVATAEVDGNDVEAVEVAARRLVERARAGGGPGFLEARTYRLCGHSKSDPRRYRTREEEASWRERDPIETASRRARDLGVSAERLEELHSRAREEIDEAVRFALASPPGDIEIAGRGVFRVEEDGGGSGEALPPRRSPSGGPAASGRHPPTCRDPSSAGPPPGARQASNGGDPPGARQLTMVEALHEALAEEMDRDERVFLMGEDIGTYGGAFGVSRDLLDRFGAGRVRQTPIAENSFVAMAVGAAMMGMRPVAEIMFGDFVALCADALVNHAAKIHYMYAGALHVPMVLRAPVGRRHGYGATHSQSPEAWMLNVPGLKVVEPATPADAKGLLLAAIRDPNPVLFLEPKLLYPVKGEVPEGGGPVPLGRARVAREGSDVTILAFGRGVVLAEDAADQLASDGVAAEVIDLRTLAPVDLETCAASIRRTGRAVLVEEGPRTGGVTAALAAELSERVFAHLRAPLARVTGADVPIPSSPELEEAVLPGGGAVAAAALALVRDW